MSDGKCRDHEGFAMNMDTDLMCKNRELNESEIRMKRTVLESRFQGLGIALTSHCGLRCIMCRAWEKKWEIPEKTVEEVYSCLPFLRRVYWQGGEVFCSRYFAGLFEAASRYPALIQEIVTNGLRIDRTWAEKLVQANVRVTFSIDGTSKKVYEHIRRGARFEDVTENLALLRDLRRRYHKERGEKAAIRTSINFVVMKSNLREIIDTPDFAREYGIDDLTLTPIDYVGDEENIFIHGDTGVLSYVGSAVKAAREKALAYGMQFHCWVSESDRPAAEQHRNTGDAGRSNGETKRDIMCRWPWQNLFVDIGGDVKPNCICAAKVGNVQEYSLGELWNNELMHNYRDKILKNELQGQCSSNCIRNLQQGEFFRM